MSDFSSTSADDLLVADEVATIIRTTAWHITKLCREGTLPATKPGKSWLVRRGDLMAWLDEHRNAASVDGAA